MINPEQILDVIEEKVYNDHGYFDEELRFIYTFDYLENLQEYVLDYFILTYKNELKNYRIVFNYSLQKIVYDGFELPSNQTTSRQSLRTELVTFINRVLMRKKLGLQKNVATLLTDSKPKLRDTVKAIFRIEE